MKKINSVFVQLKNENKIQNEIKSSITDQNKTVFENEDEMDFEYSKKDTIKQSDDGWSSQQEDDNNIEQHGNITQSENQFLQKEQRVFQISQVKDHIIPKILDQVNEILCLDNQDNLMQILRNFKWNQQKIEEEWFQNEENLQIQIGLKLDEGLGKKYGDIDSSKREFNNNTCLICYSIFDQEEFCALSLTCGHEYCKTCWKHYLIEKIQSNGINCVFTKCQQSGCNLFVPHSFFLKNLKEELFEKDQIDSQTNYYEKYIYWHCRQFTDSKRNLKWCTKPSCEYIIEYSEISMPESIACICGQTICRKCDGEDHRPADCDQVEKWKLKEKSESENLNWIKANTKPCPGQECGTPIEKNQGCARMLCTKCKYQFCWLCMQNWDVHGYNNPCRPADLDLLKNQDYDLQNAKNSLIKFNYFYERYQNHDKSRKICQDQIQIIKKFTDFLHQTKQYPHQELQFLEEALLTIIKCRQALKWMYVVGFYMNDENQKLLFEMQQNDLEMLCEQTQGLTEVSKDKFADINEFDRSPFYIYRGELINLTNLLEQQYKKYF